MRPTIILDFRKTHEALEFQREYGPKVLSALRATANLGELSRTLRFQMPPSKNDPLYVADDEVPRRYAVFEKEREVESKEWAGDESSQESSLYWIYYFKRFE